MCGINGVFAYQTAAEDPREAELVATADHMRARGPDAFGLWRSPSRRCALANRRLAILDLSPRAHQPMSDECGHHVVTFNGAIYNYPELRAALEARGRRLRTTCDTEILLHLYDLHGPAMVEHLRGMYAFAIWDERQQGLFLARDPYGIKPLYTANDGWTFRFASQVKALIAGGAVSADPEPAGLVGFHLYGSVPEPFTLYREIRALPAGHSQWVDRFGPREPAPFADIATVLARGARSPPTGDLGETVRAAALQSERAHQIADVEVGVFLSAGIDSGAILGLMRDAGAARIRAITLAYDEFAATNEDESPLAAKVAALYGAEHTVRRVGEAEFRADLPAILEAMDQPSIDGVNTWFVSKAAREAGLKVALSGLGGDELFAGYPSFRDVPRWAPWLTAIAMSGLGVPARALAELLAPNLRKSRPKALGALALGGGYPGAYLLRRGLFLPGELAGHLPPDLVRDGLARLRPLAALTADITPDPGSPAGRVCALESCAYMREPAPPRRRLGRHGPLAGEIRTPLVDIAALTALAPPAPRLHGLGALAGKQALAAAPTLALPPEILARAKTGFGVPDWRFSPSARSPRAVSKGLASRERALDVMASFTVPRDRRLANAA